MHGIVSLLDDEHYQRIEELWAELKREFGVEGVYVTPYPHFLYQVATHYNVELLKSILQEFVTSRRAFRVRGTGLGIFTGAHPVLYIPIVRSPKLTDFHESLWRQLSRTSDSIQQYYSPEQWMPHITIGFGDLTNDNVGEIADYLSQRSFDWKITIDNIALIYDTGQRQELREKFMHKTYIEK